MKLWTRSLATLALAAPVVMTAGRAAAQEASMDSTPPAGRSLFDYLVSVPADGGNAGGLSLADGTGNPLGDAAWAAFKGSCQVSGCHAEYKSLQYMVDKKKVLAGNVAGSKIIVRIKDADAPMPQDADGNPAPLPPEALAAFTNWIQAGAPTAAATPPPTPGTGTTPPPVNPGVPDDPNFGGNGPAGQMKYVVPFPFEKLVETLAQRAQGGVAGQPNMPSMVLIPNGRSLQKDHTDAANPRVIAAFTDHPLRGNDASFTIRDRIFIGYAAKANQLEVISYNEDAARFEFQIVTDYSETGKRRVMYANRQFCAECHKAKVPLFSKNTWDETNANVGLATVMAKSASPDVENFFNIVHTRGNKGTSYALDASTDRGGRLPYVSAMWQKGCRNAQGMTPEACRAGIFVAAMAGAAGVDVVPGAGYAMYDDIIKVWKANLTELDMKIFMGNLENRNPSGFEDVQILQIPQESDRIALWTKNLTKNKDLDAAHDPKQMPVEAYAYMDGVDHAKQALDITIAALSGMVTPSERMAIPKDPAKIAQAAVASVTASTNPFGDLPLRKGPLVGNLMKNLGVTSLNGQPVSLAYQKSKGAMPPIEVDNGSAATGSGLFVIVNACGPSCHGVTGFNGNLDFLNRQPGATDADLWVQMIKREKGEFCRRLNWADPQVDSAVRMPRGPRIQDYLKDEKDKGISDRKAMIESYRDKLAELAADPAKAASVGLSADELTGIAAKCVWTKYSGN